MWNSPGDGVNPLDDNFVRKRIRISDFVSPVHQLIEEKVFDRCEIIGPAMVIIGSNMHNPQFLDTNFVCVKDGFPVFNAIEVRNCSFINCKFYRLTVIVPESGVSLLPSVPFLSRTPAEFNLPVPWTQQARPLPVVSPSPMSGTDQK